MTKIPNVDWELIKEAPSHAIQHPSDARQDNWGATGKQMGGISWTKVEGSASAPVQATDPHFTLKTCQCPYGWHAIHKDCHPAPFWPAGPVPQYDGWPIMGVGQSMFSPEEIAHWRAEALKLYQESMNEVQAANAQRAHAKRVHELFSQWDTEDVKALNERLNTREPVNGRYLEGDTEFSDNDIEDFYLGKAT